MPVKNLPTDSGYDVTAINFEIFDVESDIWIADTGIAVMPPDGFYLDLVARSSLPKKGWQFLGGVGIIDRSYTGSIKLYLKRILKNVKPKTPFVCAQLIPRPIYHFAVQETDEMSNSIRGAGGYGSSDKKGK
jgi:dUTP pyrophosphatase